jgi:hypothetical protein
MIWSISKEEKDVKDESQLCNLHNPTDGDAIHQDKLNLDVINLKLSVPSICASL